MKELIGAEFKVLDDGFIRVVDFMGDDSSIVQAARISYGAGTKTVQDDQNLIRYLMRNNHTSPFEMCEIKLHVRVPMDTWRQWIRHRMASVNEYSTRYSEAIDSMQKTRPDKWRAQSNTNKQGSEGTLPSGIFLSSQEDHLHKQARDIYKTRIEMGVSRELARKDLPLCTYTEAYWKIDLHNLLNFLRLRMDRHAQEEIRSYAKVIGEEIVSKWVPLTWGAFRDYRLNSMTLSASEIEFIANMFPRYIDSPPVTSSAPLSRREIDELKEKLKKLNFPYNIFIPTEVPSEHK